MTTKRILTLAAVGTLAAVSTIAISVTTWLGASAADAGTVHLHLGTDSQKFTYGSTTQAITVGKNSCAINNPDSGTLIKLSSSANGGRSAPGLANYGLGVKESPSSGNGNPCAQIAGSEVLTITPGSQLSGHAFRQVRFDLEMTGDALVSVNLSGVVAGVPTSHLYKLQTGHSITSDQTDDPDYDLTAPYVVSSGGLDDHGQLDDVDACASPNSSGPNSAGNDNCQWTITPGFDFNKIEISSANGTATVEGGGDFPAGSDNDTLFVLGGSAPVAVNDPAGIADSPLPVQKDTATPIDVLANDTDADGDPLIVADGSVSDPPHGSFSVPLDKKSILYTPDAGYVGLDSFTYRAFDGFNLSNVATVRIRVCGDSKGPLPEGVTADFTRLTDPGVCKSSMITFDADETTIRFSPDGEGAEVNYRGEISFGPTQPVVDGLGGTLLTLKYDRDGDGTLFGFEPVPWCINPHFTAGLVDDAGLPGDDTWCIATETTTGEQIPDSTNVITKWQVFGRDDPNFQR